MKVVVFGGTRFIGRAIVEELAAAGPNELLIVHRGYLEPDDMPPVKHLHAERSELAAFRPDAAIDCRALTRARMILEAAESDAELVRVADDLLPEDLKPTGTMTQHIAASVHKARSMLGWTTSDLAESLRTTVRRHLANPPPDPDLDFSSDDVALAGTV